METVSPGMRTDPWYGTIFLFLEQIAPSWRHISALIYARVVGSRVDVVTFNMWWNGESCEILADFSQRWQGIRQRRRTRALLCTLMLWFHGKVCFSGSIISLISRCEWIKSARRLVIRVNFCLLCREKFCKKTVYSGIELICEFAKIWLIITKTCFDSFLLFLLVWLLCKSFWKAVWRVWGSLVHLHTVVQRVHCPSRCFKIVKKSWKRLVSMSFVLKYYNNFHQRSPKGY